MKPTPRALALVAVLALPVAAVVVTLLLRGSGEPVNEHPVVRIGGADGSRSELPSLGSDDTLPASPDPSSGSDGPERPPRSPANPRSTHVVPPPPPVDDDDDDDDEGDDDRDDDRDDDDDD
ncbi:hypothetical protein GCM10009676_12000 [Prauserella halophila]|uniref:Small secreted hydrophilic protein n=1 Tax=Prauserella halophila TaxID=185641 RepID=A0ABN1W1T9_9PSEU|nr:hypothetical protein [Prauserella halophila]MCP2236581.1 hypothetical protein [Prauserella halophila]